jgi:hypothetical protein
MSEVRTLQLVLKGKNMSDDQEEKISLARHEGLLIVENHDGVTKGLEMAKAFVQTKAAEAFVEGKDDVASRLRTLANSFDQLIKDSRKAAGISYDLYVKDVE